MRVRRTIPRGFQAFLLIAVIILGPAAIAPAIAQAQSSAPPAQQESKAKHEEKTAPPEGTTHLQVIVTSKKSGKPIDNASVYIRFPEKPGSSKLSELDMKTDEDGRVKIPSIPQGKVMVQVVAPHWRTFGQWFDVEKPEMDIPVQLEEPSHWY